MSCMSARQGARYAYASVNTSEVFYQIFLPLYLSILTPLVPLIISLSRRLNMYHVFRSVSLKKTSGSIDFELCIPMASTRLRTALTTIHCAWSYPTAIAAAVSTASVAVQFGAFEWPLATLPIGTCEASYVSAMCDAAHHTFGWPCVTRFSVSNSWWWRHRRKDFPAFLGCVPSLRFLLSVLLINTCDFHHYVSYIIFVQLTKPLVGETGLAKYTSNLNLPLWIFRWL